MFEVRDGRKGSNERGYVCSGMKQWGVLFDKKIGHLPAAVSRRSMLSGRLEHVWWDNRFVDEGLLLAGDCVDQRGKKCLRAVRHDESKFADMLSNPVQCSHAGRFSEDAGSESDLNIFEQVRCRADTEIMARQAKRGKIFFGNGREEGGSSLLCQPELQKAGVRHGNQFSCQISQVRSPTKIYNMEWFLECSGNRNRDGRFETTAMDAMDSIDSLNTLYRAIEKLRNRTESQFLSIDFCKHGKKAPGRKAAKKKP